MWHCWTRLTSFFTFHKNEEKNTVTVECLNTYTVDIHIHMKDQLCLAKQSVSFRIKLAFKIPARELRNLSVNIKPHQLFLDIYT